jgi:hypothetical protein
LYDVAIQLGDRVADMGDSPVGVAQNSVVAEQSLQAELLSIIWQAIQRGEEEREEDERVRGVTLLHTD